MEEVDSAATHCRTCLAVTLPMDIRSRISLKYAKQLLGPSLRVKKLVDVRLLLGARPATIPLLIFLVAFLFCVLHCRRMQHFIRVKKRKISGMLKA